MISKKGLLKISFLTMMIFLISLISGVLIDIPIETPERGITFVKYGGMILFFGILSGIMIKKYYPEKK